jgi:putative nucleotidyltransferase with HDIG domain
MTTLGPAPAVAIGLVAMTVEAVRVRIGWLALLNNVSTYAVFLLLGGLLSRALFGGPLRYGDHLRVHGLEVGPLVCVVFAVTNALNFLLIALHQRFVNGRSLALQTRTLLVPMLPSQAAAMILTAVFATAYADLRQGFAVLFGLVVVMIVFMALVQALRRSEQRGDELAARTNQLVNLQAGVLVTLVETLALRDPATARHAAAVAHLARALGEEIGLGDEERELVHTAGLLHDIAKFALPDRILNATTLSDEDWALVRRHSQDGANLVGRLDGYGPVAEIILYQHERIDGTGYPAGLIGREIPLLSRVLAVCDTFDVLTARDSYRTPVTPVEAFAELRRAAGRQLDADLVDRFIVMFTRDRGRLAFGDRVDFEAELAHGRLAATVMHRSA